MTISLYSTFLPIRVDRLRHKAGSLVSIGIRNNWRKWRWTKAQRTRPDTLKMLENHAFSRPCRGITLDQDEELTNRHDEGLPFGITFLKEPITSSNSSSDITTSNKDSDSFPFALALRAEVRVPGVDTAPRASPRASSLSYSSSLSSM